MTSIVAIRDALKVRLQTITGLRVHDTVPASIDPPAAVVAPERGTFLRYDQAFGGTDDVAMVITLFVSKRVDRVSQDDLDAYLADSGALSIKAAVDGDMTLAGTAHYAVVTEARDYGVVEFGVGDAAISYLSCEFAVAIGTA